MALNLFSISLFFLCMSDNEHHAWTAPANLEENPYLIVDVGPKSHIEVANVEFTDPPKEFLVSGSPDGGHTWRQVYGTDLNSNFATKIPVHGDYTHLKLTFLEPSHNGIRQFGVRHVALYGKQMPEPFVGSYPIFGPVGHFDFEHLRGPVTEPQAMNSLMELNQELTVANSKLAVAEEHYQASTDQSVAGLLSKTGGSFHKNAGAPGEGLFSRGRLAGNDDLGEGLEDEVVDRDDEEQFLEYGKGAKISSLTNEDFGLKESGKGLGLFEGEDSPSGNTVSAASAAAKNNTVASAAKDNTTNSYYFTNADASRDARDKMLADFSHKQIEAKENPGFLARHFGSRTQAPPAKLDPGLFPNGVTQSRAAIHPLFAAGAGSNALASLLQPTSRQDPKGLPTSRPGCSGAWRREASAFLSLEGEDEYRKKRESWSGKSGAASRACSGGGRARCCIGGTTMAPRKGDNRMPLMTVIGRCLGRRWMNESEDRDATSKRKRPAYDVLEKSSFRPMWAPIVPIVA